MPGRTPHEAVDAFLEPFRDALKVLDTFTKILVAPKGGYRAGVKYSWILNGSGGADLGTAGVLIASMEFEVVPCDPETNEFRHPYRVSTRSYHYKLQPAGGGADLWRMHWHPEGDSPVTYAHLHLPPDLKRHLPSERMTFEKALAWCAASGAPLTCSQEEAANRLVLAETPHRLNRSWV